MQEIGHPVAWLRSPEPAPSYKFTYVRKSFGSKNRGTEAPIRVEIGTANIISKDIAHLTFALSLTK